MSRRRREGPGERQPPMARRGKVRLDQLLVQRGLAETRARAQALILAGQVRVAGAPGRKPGQMVDPDAPVEVLQPLPYVSRGGFKLAHALDRFGVDPAGWVCLDVGASTGGFTDVLLQRGAVRVYAVDVGYGQLHWRLRQDPRVVVLERTHILRLTALPEPVDLATVDVSFISLIRVLPAVLRHLKPRGELIALVKPQFEAERRQVGKRGVVRDPEVHRQVLARVLAAAADLGLVLGGLTASPLLGPEGNVEFLAWWRREGRPLDRERAIAAALEEGAQVRRAGRRRSVPEGGAGGSTAGAPPSGRGGGDPRGGEAQEARTRR